MSYSTSGTISDGFNEVRIAVIMLWASVVFGLGTIAARFLALQAVAGGPSSELATSLVLTGFIFIIVQSQLIMRLAAGRGAIRGQILFLAILRIVIYFPAFPQMFAISPLLLIFPIIAAILQAGALFLLYTPPGARWFATHTR